jgi:hypothetical protein
MGVRHQTRTPVCKCMEISTSSRTTPAKEASILHLNQSAIDQQSGFPRSRSRARTPLLVFPVTNHQFSGNMGVLPYNPNLGDLLSLVPSDIHDHLLCPLRSRRTTTSTYGARYIWFSLPLLFPCASRMTRRHAVTPLSFHTSGAFPCTSFAPTRPSLLNAAAMPRTKTRETYRSSSGFDRVSDLKVLM